MSSVQVECWNCGLKLSVVIEKLATARCGNCQQMIVREGQPEVNKSPNSAPGETRAIEVRPTAQRQEEKKTPSTSAPRAEDSNSYASANSARTTTPKKTGQVGMLLGIPVLLILAVPVPLVLGFIGSAALPTIVEFIGIFLKYKPDADMKALLRTLGFGVGFLLSYIGFVARGISALKEGEGFLYALYVSSLEPVGQVIWGVFSSIGGGKK